MNQNEYVPNTEALRAQTTVSGRQMLVPGFRTGREDRVFGSNGTNELDRVEFQFDGNFYVVERRDIVNDDGTPIQWQPYELSTVDNIFL